MDSGNPVAGVAVMQLQADIPLGMVHQGDVLALLTPVQDLRPGFYVLEFLAFGWAALRTVIDDEENEKLLMTDEVVRVPIDLLDFFTPVGIQLGQVH